MLEAGEEDLVNSIQQMRAYGEIRQDFQLPAGQGVRDIWREIFHYLTDPTDFHNLLLASPDYFEPLLDERKCRLLFPLALKVLDRRDYIPKSTTLECRLVSKLGKTCIGKWIRDGNPCLENLFGWDHDWRDPKHDDLHCWTSTPVPKWLNHVEIGNTKCNPFVEGCVSLDLTSELMQAPQLFQDLNFLLAHFGNEIRYFEFHAYISFDECLKLLCEFLEQMPNLRTLLVADHSDHTYTSEKSTSQLVRSALPNLKDLSTLRIYGMSSHLLSVVLEKFGNQLKKLCLARICPRQFSRLPLGFVRNLQHVSLPWIREAFDFMEYSNQAQEWLSTLETLSVNINAFKIELAFREVLAALENCFGTSRKLQNLNIYLKIRDRQTVYIATPVTLFLPSLKRLWILCGYCCLLSIDFILGMRETLEEFTLDIHFFGTIELHQDCQFTLLMNRMYESAFWEEMIKLERITIRKKIGSAMNQVVIYRGQQKPPVGGNQ